MKERIMKKLLHLPVRRVFTISAGCALFGLLFILLDEVCNFSLEATFLIMAPVQVFGIALFLLWHAAQLLHRPSPISWRMRLVIILLLFITAAFVIAIPFCYYMAQKAGG